MKFNTKLLHGQAVKKYSSGSTLPEIAQVNAFRYDTAEELEKVFANKSPGYSYSRIANPTVSAFERRINEIEGGYSATACSSGMSAITIAILNFLSCGDEFIASSKLYGGSLELFENFRKFGITPRYVNRMTPDNIEPLINGNTRAIFGEVLSNPGLEIMDIKKISELAHKNNIPLIVDATTVTPYLVNPIALGADIVIHSTTKYINGSGDALGGVVIDGAKFEFDFEKFIALENYKKFGKLAYTIKLKNETLENIGCCMAPLSAFLNVIGLETLGLRMERICENAKALAEALNEFSYLNVNYPLLNDNKKLASSQLGGMGGGILTFRANSKERAYKLINALKYAVKATSIGDTRTLIIHPASTIHRDNTQEQCEAAGVFDDTIRVSVGIEDSKDLIEDFTDALKKIF
ncbi:MAG: O-acetylhomoserine aminocarboxypropyltransferase/cysteine synthase [Synergistaceae bacterium]|nr:O-acetylhomoserine aminocarboxypropyltransferase/cysteine synthase [Synergistaceae bacterium]